MLNWFKASNKDKFISEDEKQQQIYEVIQVMKRLDNVIKTFDFEEKLTNKMLNQEKLENMFRINTQTKYDYKIPSNMILEIITDVRNLLSYIKHADCIIKKFMQFEKDNLRARDDPLYLEYLNIQQKNQSLTNEKEFLTNRVNELSSVVNRMTESQEKAKQYKNELREKNFIQDEMSKNLKDSKAYIEDLENDLKEIQEDNKKFRNENELLRKSLNVFSVPRIIDVESTRDCFNNKFTAALINKDTGKDDYKANGNKIQKTLIEFQIPQEIINFSQTSKIIKQQVLQRTYTLPLAQKNVEYDEKTIEWERFNAYANVCKKSFAANTGNYRKLIKRYLVHDYDIKLFVEDYLKESWDLLENLLYSYANPDEIAAEKEKELGSKLKSKFQGVFSKAGTLEEKAEVRKEKLNLRLKKHIRHNDNMTKHADELLSGSIFQNFLFAKHYEQPDLEEITADEFMENQNKYYKKDVENKIKEYILTFTEQVQKYNEDDFDTLKQLVLYFIKESCRSNILIQLMVNELTEHQDLKDQLYSEIVNINIYYSKLKQDYYEREDNKQLTNPEAQKKELHKYNSMNSNLETALKKKELDIMDLNEEVSNKSQRIESLTRVKENFKLENESQRQQLTYANSKVENITNRSLEIEYIQEKLSGILNEIKI